MAIVYTDSANYTAIANAIRGKNGSSDTYQPDEMAAAITAIPTGTTPTGTINIPANGTYDVTDYASAEVNTNPAKGLVFGNYDSDGYPHSAEFVGTWTSIPGYFLYRFVQTQGGGGHIAEVFKNITEIEIPGSVVTISDCAFWYAYLEVTFNEGLQEIGSIAFEENRRITEIIIPASIVTIKGRAFNSCAALQSVTYKGNVPDIMNGTFKFSSAIMLHDFSNASSVPSLYDVASLGHASGCVIKIPSALSDTTLGEGNGWESETNWVDLTNIVWQVV